MAFTATALIAIIAFGFLSRWQFDRAAEEAATSSIVAANSGSAPVGVADLLEVGEPLPSDLEWRTVTATGDLECSSGVLIRNRPLDLSNGLWVACPLVTAEGATLWVNRGWLPAGTAATEVIAMPGAPTATVTVVGRLRASEAGPLQQPGDLPEGQVTHLDVVSLGAAPGSSGAYGAYLDATAMTPTDPAGLREIPVQSDDGFQNISYAMQWLIFAGIAVGGWYFFLRREARESYS